MAQIQKNLTVLIAGKGGATGTLHSLLEGVVGLILSYKGKTSLNQTIQQLHSWKFTKLI